MSEDRLTPKQQQALMLLLAGCPQRDVAHSLGVSEQTVSRWRHHDPHFKLWYEDSARSVREAALIEAHAGSRESFQSLRGVVANSRYDPAYRISAAKFLICAAAFPPPASGPQSDDLASRVISTLSMALSANLNSLSPAASHPPQPGAVPPASLR